MLLIVGSAAVGLVFVVAIAVGAMMLGRRSTDKQRGKGHIYVGNSHLFFC